MGIYLFQIFLHYFESYPKSPESSLIPNFVIPAYIKTLATMIVFNIPDYKVEYESISVVKLFGKAFAKFKNAANSPSCV